MPADINAIGSVAAGYANQTAEDAVLLNEALSSFIEQMAISRYQSQVFMNAMNKKFFEEIMSEE